MIRRIPFAFLLLGFCLHSVLFSATYNDLRVVQNSALEDSIKQSADIAPDSVLLVFQSEEDITIDCSMNPVTPVREGILFKVKLPLQDGKKTIAIKHPSTLPYSLNFGLINKPNYQEILQGGKIRAYSVKFYTRVKAIDRTKELIARGFPFTPTYLKGNAALIFTTSSTNTKFSFESSASIDTVTNLTAGEYVVYIKPQSQMVSVYSQGYDTGHIHIDSIDSYKWRGYELVLPKKNQQESTTPPEPKQIPEPPFSPVTLHLISEPPGAKVRCNGMQYDQITPFRLTLSGTGKYSFVFKLERYTPLDTSITIDNTWKTVDSLNAFLRLAADTTGLIKLPDTATFIENETVPINKKPPEKAAENWIASRKNRLILSAILSAGSALGGIVANVYAEKKYDNYADLEASSNSSKYDDAWDRVLFFRNSRNAAYIVSGCFAAVFTFEFSLKLLKDN